MSPAPARVGTFRPASTLPPKLLEGAVVGTALGLVACLARRRLDLPLVALSLAFVVLLDLDHLPSLLGVAQPIRPAHSLTFLALELVVFAVVLRKLDVVSIAASAWFGHMASDVGIFAIFAPFSFSYYSISSYEAPLAAAAIGFALLAGYAKARSETG